MKKNKLIKDLVLVKWLNSEVAEIWLNRPLARNAYSKDMLEHLISTLIEFKNHKKIKICLIRAKGVDFCAGGDIKSMLVQSDLFEGPSKKLEATYKKYIQRLSLTLDEVNYLTIAVVQGGAIGAGAGLALACDLVWCTQDAYFKLPFFHLALVPADGSFWRLQRKIGHSKAMGMLLRAKPLTSKAAMELGIIDQILGSLAQAEITGNLLELKTQLFTKKDWSQIIFKLRSSANVPLETHLKHMRQLQAKLQLQKQHTQAIRSILK